MRVTRESLTRIAKETTQERAYNDKDIIAAYITGSIINPDIDPLLGGTADIDLVFVHTSIPTKQREFVKLTPDFHVDIFHRSKAEFKSPRELRNDPWLGYEMYAPILIYEREKFFDFVQAGLRAGFEFGAPALTYQRCRKLLTSARQIWMELSDVGETVSPVEITNYFNCLYYAINTIAELNGPPLYERRLLLDFPARAEQADRAGMAQGVLGLLGALDFGREAISLWLGDWKFAYLAACGSSQVDVRITPIRLNYYEKAIKAMLDSDNPQAAIFPLMNTWTLAATVLPDSGAQAWYAATTSLGLQSENFSRKIEGLDQFLDDVDICLEQLATDNGLDTSSSGF